MKKYRYLKDFEDHKKDEVVEMDETDAKGLVGIKLIEEVVEDKPKDDAPVDGEVLLKSVKELVAAGIEAGVKAVMTDVNSSIKKQGIAITVGGDRREDDPANGFKNFGEFCQVVKGAGKDGGRPDERLMIAAVGAEKAGGEKAPYGSNEGSGADGGFLVPPEFSNRMLERTEGELDIMGQTDRLTLAGNSITVNGSVDHDKSSTTYRYGGVIPYWVGEAAQITRSHLKFRQVTLRLNKLAVLSYVTDEELEDANVNFGQRLTDKSGLAIRTEMTEALMFGNGVGKPLGAFNSAAAISVAIETGQAAETILAENAIKMVSRLYGPSQAKAMWYYNPEAFIQLVTMVLNVGTGGHALWMPAGGVSGAPHNTLFGRPAMPTDHCEALGTAGDLCVGDFSQYLFATKGTVKASVSIHLRFDYDETAFKFTWRADGRPAWDAALTPRKGSATTSPFVKIAVRA